MLLLNAIFRLFGYEWIRDESPYERDDDLMGEMCDEGWDDLHETSPRYVLRKLTSDKDES